MKRRVYVWLCLLLSLTLSACAGTNTAASKSPEAEASAQTADAQTSPETEASEETKESVETQASGETKESVETQTSGETEISVEIEQSPETEQTPETAEARDLSESELRRWGEYLSQIDCYGFLMSAYDTPLDADLGQVFYSGAGVGESPTQEMIDDYLKETGLEEAYTEITFIPYDAANEVLQRRTGYTLEHFRLSGNDIPMFYSQQYAGYFQMAGDTNQMVVECVSGRENPDGSIVLESREKSWSDEPDADDGFLSSFETTLRPDAQGRGMLFDGNVVKDGWLTWVMDDFE